MSSSDKVLCPAEVENYELGYNLVEVRPGRFLRVIHRPCEESDVAVFFVHGGGGRAGQFKHLIKSLENVVNIIAFDFLGHGASPHINQHNLYTADEHLQDLIAVYNKYKQERNVYVAHSYGNIHVLRHLKRLKLRGKLEELAGVFMIAVGTHAPVKLGLAGKLPAFMLEWLRPLARSTSNATIFTPSSDPALIEFENSISDTNRMYTIKTIALDCSDQERWSRWLSEGRTGLVGTKVPCALVAGELDKVFSVEETGKLAKMMKIPKNCYHVIKGAGHLPILEQSEEVSFLLRHFLIRSSGRLQCMNRQFSAPLQRRADLMVKPKRKMSWSL